MNKPADAIEKEFNDGGIFFLQEKSITDPAFQGRHIGIDVEIAVMSDQELSTPDFSVSIINRRDVAVLFTDWSYVKRGEQNILKLSAFIRVPDGIPLPPVSAMARLSFLDLCFFAGNEAIPEVYGEDIYTQPREGSYGQDLGWVLSSRFIDTMIDALGKLDNTMLGGNMKNALLYGPIIQEKV